MPGIDPGYRYWVGPVASFGLVRDSISQCETPLAGLIGRVIDTSQGIGHDHTIQTHCGVYHIKLKRAIDKVRVLATDSFHEFE